MLAETLYLLYTKQALLQGSDSIEQSEVGDKNLTVIPNDRVQFTNQRRSQKQLLCSLRDGFFLSTW